MSEKWDMRFLELAKHVSSWSKDPNLKCGAVVTNGRRIVSIGFNGFPQGVRDDERYQDRELKRKIVVHAEMNAILFAGRSVAGCTMYSWPILPCSKCAAMVIQSGITRCVFPPLVGKEMMERWLEDWNLTHSLLLESVVRFDCIKMVEQDENG